MALISDEVPFDKVSLDKVPFDKVPFDKVPIKEILDLDQLKKLFGYFSTVTGLDVALFDYSGVEILVRRAKNSVCQSARNCKKCREYIAYGGLMASELGEPYIYSCGCGLIICSSPVMFGDKLIGSIACGPALLWDADDIAISEFREKIRDMDIQVDVDKLFRQVVSCNCMDITSAARILFIIVNSLSREHSRYLNQRAKITEQQARITELIIDKKHAIEMMNKKKKPPGNPVYPEETEKEFLALVQSGNKEQSNRVLNILLGEIFSYAGGKIETIRIRLFEIMAFLSRSAMDSGAPLTITDSIAEEAFSLLHNETDFERICYSVTRLVEVFIDKIFIQRELRQLSEHLAKAVDYIMENYYDEITLNRVAGAIFVSSFYLSHLFRKELDTTFSDYLCRVRINNAKTFLKSDRQIKIQEVTEKVGFNDPNYFAKSFKRLTGVTPREYQAFFNAPA
jgi:two-component system response regulator YesN